MKPSNRTLILASVCSVFCVFLSTIAIAASQIAFSRFRPDNNLGLSQDPFYAMSGWAFLLYDLVHVFVVAVFALVLARAFSWEAWMGGGALVISSLANFASLFVNIFFLMAALRALAQGRPIGLANPEAGYEVICSTLDFAQASFGLVGTLFLAAAAINASGTARIAGWFLLAGLPISFFQIAEVGLHTPWTFIVNVWVTPLHEVVQHILITITLLGIIHHRLYSRVPRPSQETVTPPHSVPHSASEPRSRLGRFRILKPGHSKTTDARNNFLKIWKVSPNAHPNPRSKTVLHSLPGPA
jgi:hypothetical protein